MIHGPALKPLLKRGALIATANWQVVVLQFLVEGAFKALLILPLVAAAFLVAVLIGADVLDVAGTPARELISLLVAALLSRPAALTAWVLGALVCVLGGAALTFLVKGGTVSTLVRAERETGGIEHRPIGVDALALAACFDIDLFVEGCRRLFPRYLALGLLLIGTYAAIAAAYLAVVYWSYGLVSETPLALVWTFIAATISSLFVLVVTVVNLVYLLVQVVMAVEGAALGPAARAVARFLRAGSWPVAAVFAVMLALVGVATVASVLATAGLGFIGFIPFVGLAVLPLQLLAWVARGLIFQAIGLTALCAYHRLYREHRSAAEVALAHRPASVAGHTA